MNDSVLRVRQISKRFGGLSALSDVSLDFYSGTVVALIGTNGAGKTTLFDVISGFTHPDAGEVLIEGLNVVGLRPEIISGFGIARTFQSVRLARNLTVLENFQVAIGGQSAKRRERWGICAPSATGVEVVARRFMDFVRLQCKFEDYAGDLSFGEQKLLSLGLSFAGGHRKMILLDEPFAGVEPPVIAKISAIVRDWKLLGICVIVIEHDIEVLMTLADRVIVLEAGVVRSDGDSAGRR